LVDAAHGQLVVALDRERDARGSLNENRVGEAERELDARALLDHAVAGADDLEALGVALRHTDDVVVDERAGEAVQRAREALVVGTGDQNLALLDLDLDGAGDDVRQLALGTLDGHLRSVDGDGDASGDVNGKTSN